MIFKCYASTVVTWYFYVSFCNDLRHSSLESVRQWVCAFLQNKVFDMWILGIYVLISLLPDFHQCGCDHRCHWVAWEPWNSCSEACGGGYKYRYRQLCCRVENGKVIDYDLCLQECKKSNSDSREYTFCNTSCHNGGSFHFDHHDINSYTYNYGHCICSQKYGGACCDKCKYTYRIFLPLCL